MKIISFSENETEEIRKKLKENDSFYTLRISSEYGKYKKGDFVKNLSGERFIVIDLIQIKGFEDFKKRYIHYKELKNTDLEYVKSVANYKRIEIIKLKKVKAKNSL